MLFHILMLQNPKLSHLNSKAASSRLSRRLVLWREGSFIPLMEECRTIQTRFTKRPPSPRLQASLSSSFSKLMLQGRTQAALRLLSDRTRACPLYLDALPFPDNPSGSVLDHLIQKHPSPHSINEEAVILPNSPSSNHEPHSILFEGIEGRTIKNAALRVSGAAGPSGIDSMMMRRLCVSFGSKSEDLCNSLALVARRLCSSYVDPDSLSAFLSCQLIALDKCPGVRPIGIGETCRRVIAKAVLWFFRDDIIDSVGPIQTCAGQQDGCEASVHAMRAAFQSDDIDALLLVDASNAFNSLNRGVALRNILYLCPSFARILINTYRSDVRMFINGQTIVSSEGTTQGDPLPMSMYALATLPLINHLAHPAIIQSWYAD